MEREIFDKYPDYLKDFETIALLADWQWTTIASYISEIKLMFTHLILENTLSLGDCWNKIADFPPGINKKKAMIKLHQRYAVTTLEVLKSYISCWIDENNFTVEYDIETMTVTIKAEKRVYYEEYYDRIRAVIPCNMMLVIETVEELG